MLDGQVHFFESHVTPTGPIAASSWIDYWRTLHADFEHGWDGFMANSQTFYAPDLTPFVERAAGAARVHGHAGQPTLNVVYTNPIDGVTMYSLAFAVPNTGHLIEARREPSGSPPRVPRGARRVRFWFLRSLLPATLGGMPPTGRGGRKEKKKRECVCLDGLHPLVGGGEAGGSTKKKKEKRGDCDPAWGVVVARVCVFGSRCIVAVSAGCLSEHHRSPPLTRHHSVT